LLGARHNLPGLLHCAKPTSVWEEDTMTELLHLGDSYLREFHASVVAQSNQAVRLDRTVFYPGGAGQRRLDARVRRLAYWAYEGCLILAYLVAFRL
jgi:hypothetical protein